jgi:hypothetical protein
MWRQIFVMRSDDLQQQHCVGSCCVCRLASLYPRLAPSLAPSLAPRLTLSTLASLYPRLS